MFLELLPAELRIQVYHVIIERTIITKSSITFATEVLADKEDIRLYRGLLLSCKRVFDESKSEAAELILPVDSIHELWTFGRPPLVALPSESNFPTHIHIILPISLFHSAVLSSRNILAIMPTLLAYRSRITFSISRSSFFNSKPVRRAYLPRLYNTLCELVALGKPRFPSGLSSYCCPLSEARKMWLKKGYGKRTSYKPPFRSCDYVALHVEDETVVFDAHMSKSELRGADSGHLWLEANSVREAKIREGFE